MIIRINIVVSILHYTYNCYYCYRHYLSLPYVSYRDRFKSSYKTDARDSGACQWSLGMQ